MTVSTLLAVQQALGQGQQLDLLQTFKDGGFMMWPLGTMALLGVVVIVWKFIDLQIKTQRTRVLLGETDQLLAEHRIDDAIRRCEESQAPAAAILLAGLKRRKEGTERVMKAIENAGLFELAGLERGLVWLATLANVAPLTGFLGTVIGMIQAFQAIELAGEVEATTVAGGIKVALITTAAGLTIAIPINIAHNYFVTKIDRLVIEMEESAQRMIDALHEIEAKTTTV
ncbi:MAG: MotA/TolQ/ExbB proton channel family protein [Candidatus Palauibacterales bacterium]|nr:MotA/TolQ/ExbB proton channel family protein [Candidatus Palauibacterales bacterium]